MYDIRENDVTVVTIRFILQVVYLCVTLVHGG